MTLLLLLHQVVRTAAFLFFLLHFLLREDRLFLGVLFFFFACSLAAREHPPPPAVCCCSSKLKMHEVVVLDDDDESAPVLSSSQSSQPPQQPTQLTQEQRSRMAQQKEIAIARRLAKEESGSRKAEEEEGLPTSESGKPPPPGILQSSDLWAGEDISDRTRPGPRRLGRGEMVRSGYPYSSFASSGYARGSYAMGLGRGGTGRGSYSGSPRDIWRVGQQRQGIGARCDEGILQEVVDPGWRSVRKRPMPGHSFGREMCGEEGGDCEEEISYEPPDWKRKCSREDEKEEGPVLAQLSEVKAKLRPSEQQMQVLNAIRQGKSVFLTGSAGTGKSFVLQYAIRLLKIIHGGEGVYVTASTGLAACALGGTTLHSFAGVGLGTGSKESLVEKAKSRRETRNRWLNAKALILDEISMINGQFFDGLDYVGRILRKRSEPFGGIQLIVTGDFYQLPPVNPENIKKYFAFQAECWDRCFQLQVELQTVFRQSDEEFVGMLNEIRRGVCSPSVRQRLKNCSGPVGDDSGVIPTRLYPRKVDVGRENDQNLRALGQPTVAYHAIDEARNDYARKQLDNVRVTEVVTLSLGAQVMLAKNLGTGVGLVNGARGVVVGFTTPDDPRAVEVLKTARSVNPGGNWPLVKFACDGQERMVGPEGWSITEGDLEVAKRTQVPLLLAWALSVHKCQGMTLDRVETDLSRAFDYGMVYVALSRVKSLEGLRLTGFDPSRIRVHPKVAQFYDNLGRSQKADEKYVDQW